MTIFLAISYHYTVKRYFIWRAPENDETVPDTSQSVSRKGLKGERQPVGYHHPFHMPIPKPIANSTIEKVTPIVPKLSWLKNAERDEYI